MAFKIEYFEDYVILDYNGSRYTSCEFVWKIIELNTGYLDITHSLNEKIPEILLLTYPELSRKY